MAKKKGEPAPQTPTYQLFPQNPRLITENEFLVLGESMGEFGSLDGIVVNVVAGKYEMAIISGNQKVKHIGVENLKPVLLQRLAEATISGTVAYGFVEHKNEHFPYREVYWSDKKCEIANLRANNFGGHNDPEMLKHFTDEVIFEGGLNLAFEEASFELLKQFKPEFLNEIEEEEESKGGNYEIPEVENIKTDIVLGDLFEIGEHRLLCGDSTAKADVERLMNGERAGFVFTSPPYNTGGFNPDKKNKKRTRGFPYLNSKDDLDSEAFIEFNKSVISLIFDHCEEASNVLWNMSYNQKSPFEYVLIVSEAIKMGYKLHETICWVKSSAIPLRERLTRKFEFLFLLNRSKEKDPPTNKVSQEIEFNVWSISNANVQSEQHGAAYPVELVRKGIELFCLSERTYDPFLGSGTTMVASHQLNRRCFGMEIDPKYCQVIVDRMIETFPGIPIKKNGVQYVI